MRRNFLAFLFALVIFCLYSKAIELSLEENKAESGTIGYVDIEKVFQKYSIKTEVREKFLDKIREKEEIIYSKKEEIATLKNQILKLKQERELAISLTELYSSFKENVSQFASQNASTSVQGVTISTFQPVPPVEIIISTANSLQDTNPIPSSVEMMLTDSDTAKVPVITMPGVGNIPMTHFKFSVSTSAADIEQLIKTKEKELTEKEQGLEKIKKDFNKELLSYEEEQTEKMLGNIYIKLKELSIREGVSVVVDKKSILFGHKAVDLTEKLISELEKEE